jgi:acetate kinase
VRVLVVNAGSSSLKLRALDGRDEVVDRRDLPAGSPLPDDLPAVDAVGHRVVHGGQRFREPTLVDDDVLGALRDLTVLAPLHQPGSLAGIEAARQALPEVPSVACFDTAFHAGLPEPAATYALPREWRDKGIRRYGFHGLSHAYAARRAAELVRSRRTVTCHLGAGASLAAVLLGACVDTTMGFTPLEGLVMATRSGSVDPGLVLWLQQHCGLSADEVAEGLTRRSGLAGLAGTGDVRAVLDAARGGDAAARLALAVYVRSVGQHVAAMAVSLGGLDALVFTGGVGEGSPRIRADVALSLGLLGVRVDEQANASVTEDADVTGAGSDVRVLVVAAREDIEIARGTRAALGDAG